MSRALMACLAALPFLAGAASAQTVEEMIQRLLPPAEPSASRGLVIEPAPRASPSLDLIVPFAFDSARLTGEATAILDRLGTALISEQLRGYRFEVAGHTDAVGRDAYNLALSDRRAEAVRAYLVSRFGIEAGRLVSRGYGESRLRDSGDPASGVNRRVEIVNLGDVAPN